MINSLKSSYSGIEGCSYSYEKPQANSQAAFKNGTLGNYYTAYYFLVTDIMGHYNNSTGYPRKFPGMYVGGFRTDDVNS